MEKGPPATDQRLDEIYREHPAGFVAGRDRLAKDLRAAGDREAAERVRKLRRPTVAAWLVNRAALTSPTELARFVAASEEVQDAQRRALEGEDLGAADLRAAAARERKAIGAILDIARKAASDAGQPASERALELVGETLRATTGDPGLRQRVLDGRVEREQSAATLGTPALASPRIRDRGSAMRQEVAQARRELERLKGELAEAVSREERLGTRVEEAAETLRQEKARLAQSRRETAGLRRRLKGAERRAKR